MDYVDLLATLARHAAAVDADHLELRLWAVVRGTQRAEARTRRHPLGIELVVIVDGDLSTSKAYRPVDVQQLEATASALRQAFEADGWLEAGPSLPDPQARQRRV